MEGVQFDEPQGYKTHYPKAVNKVSKLAGYLVEKGYAKTEKGANTALTVIAVILILLALLLPKFFSSGVKEKYIPPETDKTLEIR